jgi:hypothetical protein
MREVEVGREMNWNALILPAENGSSSSSQALNIKYLERILSTMILGLREIDHSIQFPAAVNTRSG